MAVTIRDLWTRGPAGRSLPSLLIGVAAASVPLAVAAGIAVTSTWGFLGLGVQPPVPELGRLLGDYADYVGLAPLLVLGPAFVLALLPLTWLFLAAALTERARLYGHLAWNELMS